MRHSCVNTYLFCSQESDGYTAPHSGVPANTRAAAAIAIMIKAKFKKRIHSYVFVNGRILQLRYKLQRGYLTLLAVYAPEEGKTEQTEEFYETLQDQIDQISKNEVTLSLPEFIMQELEIFLLAEFWVQMVKLATNSNGHKLKEFAPVNELKTRTTFFKHKEIYKMTLSGRGYRSVIDYILTNKKLSPLVNDT